MKHYKWTELDYIAGAAHEMHMSYGQYVCMGMPNLQRFKRRVAEGEFDKKPVRGRYRKDAIEGDQPKQKPERPVPRPEHEIKAGKCVDCGKELPPERRAGPARKLCEMCAADHRRAKARRTAARHRERQKAAELAALVLK